MTQVSGQTGVNFLRVAATAVQISFAPAITHAGVSGNYAPHKHIQQSTAMTPQDESLVNARIEAKVADLRGDIRLNTQGLESLKSRLDDLATRMSGVPADLAGMKATMAELPRKGFIIIASTGALALVAAISAFVQWVLAAHIAGH